jgi:hypothetical protein
MYVDSFTVVTAIIFESLSTPQILGMSESHQVQGFLAFELLNKFLLPLKSINAELIIFTPIK